jgi:hypothetical protein
MRRLRLARFLWIPIILVLVGTASGLVLWFTSSPDDWKGLALNLAAELVGAAVTYVLVVDKLRAFLGPAEPWMDLLERIYDSPERARTWLAALVRRDQG